MAKAPPERRKHPRSAVQEDSLLLTAPKITLSGNIIDISKGGLSFSYEEKDPFLSGLWLQIAIIRDDVAIEEIPARIVADIEMPDSPRFSRRCGVKFGALSELQKEKMPFL
jgi:hypothetical protein